MSVEPPKPTLLSTLVRHYDHLVEHIRRRFGEQGSPQDVIHEVCLQLLERQEPHDAHTPLALLRKISLDTALSMHRRERRRSAWVTTQAELPERACGASPLEQQLDAERRFARLIEAIGRLPPRCQAVFVMQRIHGITQVQIAAHLGISVKAVEKQLKKGMDACRKHLADGGEQ